MHYIYIYWRFIIGMPNTNTNTTTTTPQIGSSKSTDLSSTKSLGESHSLSIKSNFTNSSKNHTIITSKVGSTITNKGANRSHGCIHHVNRSSSIKVRHSVPKKHTSSLASNSNFSLSNKSRYSSTLEASRSGS